MSSSTERAPPAPAAPRSCCAVLWRGFLALFVIVVATGIAAWFGREADVAAVFGGGLEDRPFAAAEFFRQGLVKKIVISNVAPSRAERLGVLSPHVVANRDVLLKLGVPLDAIEVFGENLATTEQEATALHDWAWQAGVHRIIVPTEIFVTRRLSWMLHRVFGDEADVRVVALESPDYRRADWWHYTAGIIGFQNEVLKYVYYRLKY
jgi:uncharacterized SAM-binding protein YcdF (DUF218 family)